MRTGRTGAAWAAGSALVLIGAAGGFWLHSPNEHLTVEVPQAALTAPVESRVLTATYSGSGVFSTGGEVDVQVSAPSDMAAVVTATPIAAGQTPPWCGVLIEVSGRPVFVLHGAIPAYRDLTVGDTGRDVRQLQQALSECGIAVAVDGDFGPGTAHAIEALYKKAGYSATTSAADALGATATGTTASAGGAKSQVGDGVATVSRVITTDSSESAPGSTSQTTLAPQESSAPAPAPGVSAVVKPTVVAPRGELLFVPDVARLSTAASLGSKVDSEVVARLALAGDRFTIAFSAAQRAALEAGSVVTISKDDWAEDCALPALPDAATVDDNGTPTYPVIVGLTTAVPAAFYGQDGQFTITVGSPDPYDLVVPVTAVYQDTDGTTYVQRASTTRSTASTATELDRRVTVKVTASAAGYAALEVVTGPLAIGDEVVIGEK